jgi:hypothetical protein
VHGRQGGAARRPRRRRARRLDLPAAGDGDWQAALRATARSFRAALLAHPSAVPILLARPLLTPGGARVADALLCLLRRAGLSVAHAATVYPLLARFLLALVRVEASGVAAPAEVDARATLEDLAGTEHPYLAAAAPFLARPPAPSAAFEAGLELVVGGIERLAGTSRPAGA